jgi:hypothetical protein
MLLSVFRSRLEPKANSAPLARAHRVVYAVDGALMLEAGTQRASLAPNSGWYGDCPLALAGGAGGATVLHWELSKGSAQPLSGAGIDCVRLLEQPIAIRGPAAHLIRLDRVSFPLGGIAYTHTHQGPGIRCLLTGSVIIDTNDSRHTVQAGEAWFEAGPDPVLALASETELTSFARVMVLPLELIGRSSIHYVKPEDLDKPKRQTYQIYVDTPLQL